MIDLSLNSTGSLDTSGEKITRVDFTVDDITEVEPVLCINLYFQDQDIGHAHIQGRAEMEILRDMLTIYLKKWVRNV
jgi:hypothetical protein